jgi:hypothetical protein
MKRIALAVSLLLVPAAVAIAADNEAAPAKVSVKVRKVTHPMEVCKLEEGRLYPQRAGNEELKPIRQKLKVRETAIRMQAEKALPEEAAAAEKARTEWQALPKAQRSGPEGDKLRKVFDAWDATLRELTQKDVIWNQFKQQYQKTRDKHCRTIEAAEPIVTLNNGLIEVKIAPTLGMRVLNAVDLKTGLSFAGTSDPRAYEKAPWRDIIAWTAGYQELSFPYFEHGVGVRQPAGFRVIERDDGSVTVAMNMRFTEHQHPRHQSRYGRYSQRHASVWVTLKPGESCYTATYRIDNPNPLPRSSRVWTNILMEADRYDGTHIIYPAGYIMPHNGGWVKPFYAEGGKRSWQGVSHFALYPEHEFCGVYSPRTDNNCLIIRPADTAPGMKLYTPNASGGFLELWVGSTTLFEFPGELLSGYVPVQYELTFYNAKGIGRVKFANRHVAIGGDEVRAVLLAPAPGKAKVLDGAGKVLGEGPIGPHTTLTVARREKMTVQIDGQTVAEVAFPLTFKDTRSRHPQVKSLGGKYRIELEEISNHRGAPRVWHAMREARKILEDKAEADAEQALSLARACYRYGHFQTAKELTAKTAPNHRQTHLLDALIAWERGSKMTDIMFGHAGVDSYYHRALQAYALGKKEQAKKWLGKLIEQRPKVYRPRLALAYWTNDRKLAGKLAAENPASPEAQMVLELLGDADAADAKEALLQHNPGAAEQVEQFRKAIAEGKWEHVKRFKPLLPEEK